MPAASMFRKLCTAAEITVTCAFGLVVGKCVVLIWEMSECPEEDHRSAILSEYRERVGEAQARILTSALKAVSQRNESGLSSAAAKGMGGMK